MAAARCGSRVRRRGRDGVFVGSEFNCRRTVYIGGTRWPKIGAFRKAGVGGWGWTGLGTEAVRGEVGVGGAAGNG